MKTFCFTVDDNIRFLKEITENRYKSIFEHPYLAMYKRLHEKYGLKVQLNMFYRTSGFDLSLMSDSYYSEWEENSDWLKLSFHSEYENLRPYEFSGYNEVYKHCKTVQEQIIRFASKKALAETTTIHFCRTTEEGLKALKDNNVKGLLGLFGTESEPRSSYGIKEPTATQIRNGNIVNENGIAFAPIDIVMNNFSKESIQSQLSNLAHREHIWVMIHEQYFYKDYKSYQSDFEEKIASAFSYLSNNGYKSYFFEKLI